MSREQSKAIMRYAKIINGGWQARDEQEHVKACLLYVKVNGAYDVVRLDEQGRRLLGVSIATLVHEYNQRTGATLNVETIEKLVMLGANE